MANNYEQASTEATTAPGLDDIATDNNDADADKFDHITPMMAQQLINRYHAVTTDLGCWQSKRNDARLRVEIRKLRPLMYQIAFITTNRGDELKTTLGRSSYDVSHLCHDSKCFNPDHLVVESKKNNLRRRVCNGHKVIIYGDFSHITHVNMVELRNA
ncbi:zinc-binding loop region of homing endonuclease-domain-containing protein [Lipomyces starkeyi]